MTFTPGIPLAFAALLAPGLAWWAWLGRRGQDPIVSLAQVIGVSLGVIALLAQGAFLLGLKISGIIIIACLLGFSILAMAGAIKHKIHLPRRYHLHTLFGLILFGLAIAWRLYQARDLLLPNWVDSQHHYLIIRAIIEGGGLPATLDPYLSMPFYYHFGYHTAVALFTIVSGMSIGAAMLVFGQVLNAAIGLSVYALGKALWHDWCPALGAALLVTFAARMPAYYLSWGRYTLLTGMMLMPLAMAAGLNLLRKPHRWQDAVTLSLLTAGVLLSHYFTAVLLAGFFVLISLTFLLKKLIKLPDKLQRLAGLAAGAVSGFVFALSWLVRVFRYTPARTGAVANLPDSLNTLFNFGNGRYIWMLLGPDGNYVLLAAAVLGIVLSFLLRKQSGFAGWSLSLGILSLPWAFRIGPFRPDHFAIVLFLPVTLWAGWLFGQIGHWVSRHFKLRWLPGAVVILLSGGFAAWGFSLGKNIVNPVTVLVTEDDLAALDWINENTPKDARFLINTTYWLGGTYRGVDGGGWILPYTGRWALVPTVFYGFSPDAQWAGEIRQWGEEASQIETCSEDFWRLVDEADLDYVYIREGSGALQAEGLTGCEGVDEIYLHNHITIFIIEP